MSRSTQNKLPQVKILVLIPAPFRVIKQETEHLSWVLFRESAYLHHLAVRSLCFHTNSTVGSVTGAAEAAMLDLLALQFHGCRPVSDNADRFLETDALQGSLSW